MKTLSKEDSEFLKVVRSFTALGVVFAHVGGTWFFIPYSEVLCLIPPLFFFVSGTLFYHSYPASGSYPGFVGKRMVQLLVPYYMVALLSLAVYVFYNHGLPEPSLKKLFDWLTITPKNAIMPFPLGQVWFLHTLAVISLAAPLAFMLMEKNPAFLYLLMAVQLLVTVWQLNGDAAGYLIFSNHNFYKPFSNSLFFFLGMLAVKNPGLQKRGTAIAIVLFTLAASVALVKIHGLNPGFMTHTYSPDFYYVMASLCAIWAIIGAKKQIAASTEKSRVLKTCAEYLHKHIFGFFLLHTFAIFFLEKAFGLVHPKSHIVLYGIVKFTLVLALTALWSIPFTWASGKITGCLLGRIGKRVPARGT